MEYAVAMQWISCDATAVLALAFQRATQFVLQAFRQ